jgi:hypothetical protein
MKKVQYNLYLNPETVKWIRAHAPNPKACSVVVDQLVAEKINNPVTLEEIMEKLIDTYDLIYLKVPQSEV